MRGFLAPCVASFSSEAANDRIHRERLPRQLSPCQPLSYAAGFCVNRFYPKTQLSWLARLDHSHCNSADPLTDGLEVCCVFYRPGPGGAMCVVWWWKVLTLDSVTDFRPGDVVSPSSSANTARTAPACPDAPHTHDDGCAVALFPGDTIP